MREAGDEEGAGADSVLDRLLPSLAWLDLVAVDPRFDAARLKVSCQALDTLGILANMREENVGFRLARHDTANSDRPGRALEVAGCEDAASAITEARVAEERRGYAPYSAGPSLAAGLPLRHSTAPHREAKTG